MKKVLSLFFVLIIVFALQACDKEITTTTDNDVTTTNQELSEAEVYQKLIEAEELSGMKDYDGILITESKDLGLPTEYNGVVITYSSRNSEIISDEGFVTLPDSCWIESREQDGTTPMPNLNDNWPIVIDVTMEYMGQVRTAKLMFIVAPAPGFSCDKYLG